MKIVVITATEIKGITYRMKNIFLETLRDGHDITEYYLPRAMPHFCTGCKTCFLKSETLCPHAAFTQPIWQSITHADLLIFATPVYVLRVPGQLKALLDHFACHWIAHRPDERMKKIKAVIISNSIGAPNGATHKDIKTSLNWMGLSDIRRLGIGLMEGVIWDELSAKRREKIEKKLHRLAKHYITSTPARKRLKVHLLWSMGKMLHRGLAKKETELSADNQYWRDKGWI